jgi:hypothetical protein
MAVFVADDHEGAEAETPTTLDHLATRLSWMTSSVSSSFAESTRSFFTNAVSIWGVASMSLTLLRASSAG